MRTHAHTHTHTHIMHSMHPQCNTNTSFVKWLGGAVKHLCYVCDGVPATGLVLQRLVHLHNERAA